MNSKIVRTTIRLTWKQSEKLRESAKEANLNMSDYIRQFVPELRGNK